MRALAIAALVFAVGCSGSKNHNDDGGAGNGGGGAGGGAGDGGVVVPYQMSPAPTSTTISGTVLDDATGSPIANATVSIASGSSKMTNASGAFTLVTSTGRGALLVTATGYVDWLRPIGTTSDPVQYAVRLAVKAAPQTVSAQNGGTVSAGPVVLMFPAGAYAADAQVSATWLDSSHVRAAPGRWLFADSQLAPHQLTGVVHVDASAEPTSAVTFTMPVPATATMSNVHLFVLDAVGNWGAPIAPMSVSNGTASFVVSKLCDFGLGVDADPASFVCVNADPGVTMTDPTSGMTTALQAGTSVPMNAAINTNGGAVTTQSAAGDTTIISGDAQTITPQMDPSGAPTLNVQCANGGNCQQSGTSEVSEPASPMPKSRFMIRTRAAVMGVRGTVFGYSSQKCASDTSRDIDHVEVSSGDVLVTDGSMMTDLASGNQLKACEGCADPNATPACCDSSNCASGCCQSGTTSPGTDPVISQMCMPGTSAVACGTKGMTCAVCGTGSMCSMNQCTPAQTCGGLHQPCCSGSNPCQLYDGSQLSCDSTRGICCIPSGGTTPSGDSCCSLMVVTGSNTCA